MYIVTDDYGTRKRAWRRAEALAWLAACSPRAQIYDVLGRFVASRTVAA